MPTPAFSPYSSCFCRSAARSDASSSDTRSPTVYRFSIALKNVRACPWLSNSLVAIEAGIFLPIFVPRCLFLRRSVVGVAQGHNVHSFAYQILRIAIVGHPSTLSSPPPLIGPSAEKLLSALRAREPLPKRASSGPSGAASPRGLAAPGRELRGDAGVRLCRRLRIGRPLAHS